MSEHRRTRIVIAAVSLLVLLILIKEFLRTP